MEVRCVQSGGGGSSWKLWSCSFSPCCSIGGACS